MIKPERVWDIVPQHAPRLFAMTEAMLDEPED